MLLDSHSCLFQFLIGTLKTEGQEIANAEKPKFQFLIGTLKTDCMGCEYNQQDEFQFLIGTLKTLFQVVSQ